MALVADASETEDYVPFALAMDRAAKECGVNFIGGFSALVQKGFTRGDTRLIRSIPEALAVTDYVCSSINVASTRAGINMDAVRLMGEIIKATAARTRITSYNVCYTKLLRRDTQDASRVSVFVFVRMRFPGRIRWT